MNLTPILITVVALLLGTAIGIGAYAAWLKKKASKALRVPDKWPLAARGLVTHEEHAVLKWLSATFPDHLVMAKVPVLRFTKPTDRGQEGGGKRWLDMLNGVYCSFTICTLNGSVIGCVDVPGKRGLGKSAREVKESLLSDCHIAYTVVRDTALPTAGAIRAAFLGEIEVEQARPAPETMGGNSSFFADLDTFSREKREAAKEAALHKLNGTKPAPPAPPRPVGFTPDGTGSFDLNRTGGFKAVSQRPERFPQNWEDSFTGAHESRPAKLE